MDAYILETLTFTGWRRKGELYWRYSDVLRAAKNEVEDSARAVRVLPVRVHSDALLNFEAAPKTTGADHG